MEAALDFEATELPFWRKKWCLLWSGSPAGVPTSQLLGELRCWYDKDAAATWSVTELDRQTVMLEFLDGDGKTEWNMLVKDGACSNKELLELNSGSFSDKEMAVSLGMAHALDYILGQQHPLNLDDLLEVHSRVMGSAEGEGKQVCQELLDAHVGFVNSRADEIKASYPKLSEQAPAMLKLAANSLLWFHVQRPFADGNARVAELFVSNLLADLVPRGLHLRVALLDALRKGKMGGLKNSGGGGCDIKKITEQQQGTLFCLIRRPPPPPSGVEDVAALVVEAVWGLWHFTASKCPDDTTPNGQD